MGDSYSSSFPEFDDIYIDISKKNENIENLFANLDKYNDSIFSNITSEKNFDSVDFAFYNVDAFSFEEKQIKSENIFYGK